MTSAPCTQIRCDRQGWNCLRAVVLPGTLKDARARAKGLGWRRTATPPLDICPRCLMDGGR